MTKYDYDSNGIARVYDDGKWYLIDRTERRVSDGYTYIEEWGEGYYKAELGAKKNILRPDGSIVLKVWHNDVYKVKHGFFVFSNTIRKSKNNPKTRYTYGVAHVTGDVIFPMIFDLAYWMEKQDFIYAEIDEKPYIVTTDGSICDAERSHLPKKATVDYKQLFEKFANWTLPGLQFFYRDTNAPVIVDATYHVDDILRAGFFVDATTKLLKPAHKTRFLIASAHAAMFCEIEELCQENPDVKKWNLCTFHCNSYFKVMDVYEKDGVTQVFLLHIPPAAAFFLGNDEAAMNFMNEATGKETSLVDMARKSLDDKLKMDVHPRSMDPIFCKRMEHPIGLDDEFYPTPLDAADEPIDERDATLSNMIHKLANDGDIQDFIEVKDNFPFTGVEGTICEGCVYAGGIQRKGEGCGRLFTKSFRDRYLKGCCEYRKTDLFTPSQFEEMDKYRKEKAKEKEEKSSDVYALRIVRDFIKERLDGNIDKLRNFDLATLTEDEKYGKESWPKNELAKSIMALVFGSIWPNLTVDSINHYEYSSSQMVSFQNLFGSNILDKYFKGMEKFSPSKEQLERALHVAHLLNGIGNLWVLPNKPNDKETMASYKDSPKFRGYMDKYLQAMYAVTMDEKRPDMHLKGIFYKNRKVMKEYQGAEGWKHFVDNMMLQDYVDADVKPKDIFDYVWSYMKDLDRDSYFQAVDKFCTFCEEVIPKRADQMIGVLKTIMNNK